MMSWKLLRSLRTRVMLVVLVIFLCSVVLLSLISTRLLHSEMQRLLGDQQAATVSLVAADISNNLPIMQNGLDLFARATGGIILDNPALVQQFVELHLQPQLLFNGGIYVTRLDGTVMAEMPLTGRVGLNYLDKDHIATALKTGQASIGRPVISKRLHIPIFSMTVPIRDSQGQVIGAVTGVTDLSQPNLLGGIHAASYGKSGGYILVDPRHRLFVTASSNFQALIMQPLPEPGVNPVLDRRMLGFDGPAVNVSPHGIEMLTSSARIPSAGWFVIASLPTKEAFAPVDALEDLVLSIFSILSLLSGILIWVMLQRLLSPLQTASKALTDYADKSEAFQPLPILRDDEVGVLIGSFNRVITDRLQAQAQLEQALIALHESQDRLIQAQEGAHVGIWEVNYATNTTYWSPECENLYGLEPGALTCADDWRARVHPDDLPLIDAQLANITNHCEFFEVEYRFRTDSYGNRWFLSKGRAYYDANRMPIKLSGINLDMTDRKQMSAERDRLLKIVEEAPEFIGMVDMQTRFVFLNKAGRRMVGVADDVDISTLTISDVCSESALRRFWEEAGTTALSEGFWQGETALLHLDGHEIPVDQLLFVQNDASSNPEYFATISRDISEQKALLSEITQAKEAAEAATVAKSRFLATMSHEIRTPMNGILGMSQLLLMPNLQDDERHDYAQTIFTCGETLMSLLNDILDLSKIEAGKFQLDATTFDPEALLRETHALFSGSGQARNLQFEFHWLGLPGQCYKADALRVRQMLSNLISNAIKFTKHGHVRVQGMEIDRDGESALLEFSVSDTGIGIAADKMDRLFKPFSQTETSTTREYGGSGLGLSLVSNLAKAMGGDVGCESCVGQGSRFWFRLRAQCLSVDARQSERLPETQSASAHPVQLRGRVLVAEDNVVNCLVIESFLDQLGLHTTLTQDGQQTVTAITQGIEKPDIILMDLHMPVMDGYEATVQIRQWEAENQQPHLPIIALTADAYEEDRQRCQAVGMDGFLTKPIELDALTSTLAKWLKG